MFTISKNELQAFLPVLTFPTEELSNKVLDQVPIIYERVLNEILGTIGEAALDRPHIRMAVCQNVASRAMLGVFAQLDVVATPTGFGVVSNQDTAPASSARVQALKTEVYDIELRSRHWLLSQLTCIEGWGETPQAKTNITSTFWNSLYLQTYCGMSNYGLADWLKAAPKILLAENIIRRKVGTAMYLDVLHHIRTADLQDYIPLTQAMHTFTAAHIIGDVLTQRECMRQLLEELEDPTKADLYKLYLDSSAYRANHYQRKRNEKEKPGFIFGR